MKDITSLTNKEIFELGKPIRIKQDVYCLRLPMPSVLNHVNVWLLKDNDSWVLIDTGTNSLQHKKILWKIIVDHCKGKLSKVIVSHFHVDHIGLAGWVCENFNAELYISEIEWLLSLLFYQDVGGNFFQTYLRSLKKHGIPKNDILLIQNTFKSYNIYPPPKRINPLNDGDTIWINNSPWKINICKGHSPAGLSLFNSEMDMFICGDHLMPHVIPILGHLIYKPKVDLIQEYFQSFSKLHFLKYETLVLPAHGEPFIDAQNRMKELKQQINIELTRVVKHLANPSTVNDLILKEYPNDKNPYRLRFFIEKYLSHINYLLIKGAIKEIEEESTLLYQAT